MLTSADAPRQTQRPSNGAPELEFGRDCASEKKSPSGTSQTQSDLILSLVTSTEPAPIDTVRFGKRVGEIIGKAARSLSMQVR
jgi:hypothetical protein